MAESVGDKTKIEWTDHTASPWHGCEHATKPDGTPHPGCLNCYAEAMAPRNPAVLGVWGPDGTRVKSKSFIRNLRKWDREAREQGRIVSVFPSLCDPFEDRPELEPWRREMFEAIDRCPSVRLLLLTKRPQNVRGMWPPVYGDQCPKCGLSSCDHNEDPACNCPGTDGNPGKPRPSNYYRPNVHLYYSASDQSSLEAGIGSLLACRPLVPVLGLSLEPLLGPVDLDVGDALYERRDNNGNCWQSKGYLDHVIVGGESGPHARPCNVEWIRSIIRQCKAAGVPCFVKQLGSRPVDRGTHFDWPDGTWFGADHDFGNGARVFLDHSKGGDPAEWPEDLRVQQFPEVTG